MPNSSYFTEDEFKCKCGCGKDINPNIKHYIEEARALAGVPFIITSGARCSSHNEKVGGSPTSSHLLGVAVDISYTDEVYLTRIVHALSRMGFDRIGVNNSKKFIHTDMDFNKPKVIFGY